MNDICKSCANAPCDIDSMKSCFHGRNVDGVGDYVQKKMTQRERLIELLEWHYDVSHELTVAGIENLADYLLANGVVIPVRCEECKHCFKERCVHQKTVGAFAINRNKDDFCPYGERKGGE